MYDPSRPSIVHVAGRRVCSLMVFNPGKYWKPMSQSQKRHSKERIERRITYFVNANKETGDMFDIPDILDNSRPRDSKLFCFSKFNTDIK